MLDVIRVGLVDGDDDIRFGRRLLIDSQEDCQVVFEESNALAVIDRAPDALIDALVIDHRIKALDGIELVERLIHKYRELNADIPAIILTGPYFSRELLLASIAAGASDLVTLDSDSDELLKAIRSSVAADDDLDFEGLRQVVERSSGIEFDVPDILVKIGSLDDQETKALTAFKSGHNDVAISKALGISKYRVKQALESVLAKCGLATRAQLFLAINYAEQNLV
ncbi:MAG: response regulator [Rhodoluna sp.]